LAVNSDLLVTVIVSSSPISRAGGPSVEVLLDRDALRDRRLLDLQPGDAVRIERHRLGVHVDRDGPVLPVILG